MELMIVVYDLYSVAVVHSTAAYITRRRHGLKSRKRRNLQFYDRQLQIFDRGHYGCWKISILLLNPPKWPILSRRCCIFGRKFYDEKKNFPTDLRFRGPLPPCHKTTDITYCDAVKYIADWKAYWFSQTLCLLRKCCIWVEIEMLLNVSAHVHLSLQILMENNYSYHGKCYRVWMTICFPSVVWLMTQYAICHGEHCSLTICTFRDCV